MAVSYIEKGIGLWKAIHTAGYTMVAKDGVYQTSNDAAVQVIIDSYNQLVDQKADAIAGIKATALAKIQTIFPAVPDIDTINLLAEQWLSIAPAARQPTTNWTTVTQIYTAAKNGIIAVNAAPNKAAIDSAVAAIVWPI